MKLKSLPVIFLLVLTLGSNLCIAQNQKIDSLKSLLPLKSGGEYIDVLFELGRAHDAVDIKMLVRYGSQAFSLAMKYGDSARIVKCGRLKAQAFRHFGVMDSAMFLFEKILGIARRHNYLGEQKSILNSMGVVYLNTARYDKALHLYFQALSLAELDKGEFWEAVILNNIGLVYLNLRDYNNALSYLRRSLNLRKTLESKYDLGGTMINVAICLALQGKVREAQDHVNRVIEFCGSDCFEDLLQYVHSAQGIIHYKNQDFQRAEEEFIKSNDLNRINKIDKVVLENLSFLLAIRIKKKQTFKAEGYLKRIEELITSAIPNNF
jgi:tetratricopeptide (TPR) repeat protein